MMVRGSVFFGVHRRYLIGIESERAEQSSDCNFSFAVNFHGHHIRGAGVEFQPGAAIRDQFGVAQR